MTTQEASRVCERMKVDGFTRVEVRGSHSGKGFSVFGSKFYFPEVYKTFFSLSHYNTWRIRQDWIQE